VKRLDQLVRSIEGKDDISGAVRPTTALPGRFGITPRTPSAAGRLASLISSPLLSGLPLSPSAVGSSQLAHTARDGRGAKSTVRVLSERPAEGIRGLASNPRE
jgi:hypothetical protein